ncbi:hypothetical protein GRI62_11885 [Erythrobacter arachoides]|uniref:Uncharacterized protein n=1 Tax=Aurantiacibacter arachoides TaxID=1850444 RepID=A0A845A561_9SPHN|nr:hypothetical protein [Aurantiacibacter arachoides]MXO94296.1 hypothetical protein [Aurantiacibacter arachoides]GGD64571.1 hypothetical protein GCM10011411_26120 [Aurantiacibacter arachoides]
MSKFYVPARVNKAVADKGRWFTVEDEAGIVYGEFKLKFIDQLSQKTARDKKRIYAEKRINNDKENDNTKRAAASLAYISMIDWKLPTDPNDKKAVSPAFTPDDAYEYLQMEEAHIVMIYLADYASNNVYYQEDEDDAGEEETVRKN